MKNFNWKAEFPPLVVGAGVVFGVIAALLAKMGNPGNMGVCMACFERDIAGALGLHRAAPVQYLRPEIFGIVLGAALAGLAWKETSSKSGSSPAVRFVLGAFMMIGALVFLGCPTRMVLRLGGGDANALLGIAGFVTGIAAGAFLLRRQATLGRAYKEGPGLSSLVMPLLALGGIALVITKPSFIFFSEKGPGAMYAPVLASIVGGLVIGVLGQRSRLCFAGGIRDLVLFRSFHLFSGLVGVFIGVFVMNICLGRFTAGFAGQPAAHSAHIWNFAGMALVGLAAVLLGGCPFRQLVLAAQGNGDSIVAVMGMLVGGAFAHNFKLAATPKGVSGGGQIAVIAGLAICLLIGLLARDRE